MLSARNNGEKPAVLERASFSGLGPGLKYLGAYVLAEPRHCQKAKIPAPRECLFYSWKDKRGRLHSARRSAGGFIAGFAMPRDGHVLEGFTVSPGAQVVVVLGIEVTKRGRHRFQALALDYRVGEAAYRDIYESSGQLCSPTARYLNKCPALLDEIARAAVG
jgi:hypothetical protein